MGLEVCNPGEFNFDDGSYGKLYKIEDWFAMQEAEKETEIVYDRSIQRISNIQATIVAVFEEWFTSFFDPNYFNFVRLRTQSTFSEFKSFMKNIYKKTSPFLVIDPHSPEHVEDSIFGTNMINRYNEMDPLNDNIGAMLLYSEPIMNSEMFELYYRRNTFRFEFDIMIMEQTMNRQINTYNRLLMGIRHNSKFSFERTIPVLLPLQYILNIAKFHEFDYKSKEFLDFLNAHSLYPIITRTIPNKQLLFFMEEKVMINVEVPSYPSKDSPENAEQIEWGARVVDQFTFNVILPSEFIFLMPKKHAHLYVKGVDEDPESIYFISPVYSDIEVPSMLGNFKLVNRLDIMINDNDDNKLSLLTVTDGVDKEHEIGKTVRMYIESGNPISDIVRVTLYANGSYEPSGCELKDNGDVIIPNPMYNKLYCLNVYLNLERINKIRHELNTEHIGTIEKY